MDKTVAEEASCLLNKLEHANSVKLLLESTTSCIMLKNGGRIKTLNSEIIEEFKKAINHFIEQTEKQIEVL